MALPCRDVSWAKGICRLQERNRKPVGASKIVLRKRYLCHGCKYRHTVPYHGKSLALKRQALDLYLEGLGFRSIGRILNCNHGAVYTWIKAYGESIGTLRSAAGVTLIEMDKWHTYIGAKKNACGLWVAVTRQARQFLHCELGACDIARASNDGRVSKAMPSKP